MTDNVGYYDKPRADVIALVPANAKEILDVGCAAGALGRAIKASQSDVHVRGFEPNDAVASRAREVLDAVHVAGFDGKTALPAGWPAPDCILFADVLEHMVDPWSAVARACALLAKGGSIVASIPNIAHASIVASLLRGRFDYADYGILDRTHLRFFTRPTAIDLVESAGLRVREVHRSLGWHETQFDQRWLKGGLAKGLHLETSRGRRFPSFLGTIADAMTTQFVIVAS